MVCEVAAAPSQNALGESQDNAGASQVSGLAMGLWLVGVVWFLLPFGPESVAFVPEPRSIAPRVAAMEKKPPSKAADLRPIVQNLRTSAANLRTSAANLRTSATNLRTSAADLRTSVANLWTSVANLRTSVANLRTSVANLRTSAAKLRTSAANL